MADDFLARGDAALGFDWVGYVSWFDQRSYLLKPLHFAYQAIWWQPLVIGLVLVITNQERRTYVMVTVKGCALALTSIVTAFFPAYGAYTFFRASAAVLPNLQLGDVGKMKIRSTISAMVSSMRPTRSRRWSSFRRFMRSRRR